MLESSLRPRPRPAGFEKTVARAQAARTEAAEDGQMTKARELATTEAPLARDGMMLLGTFGTEASMSALIRLPDGQMHKVARGDKVGGHRVLGISDARVILQARGRSQTLAMPAA
ncbi:hypothetical protein [Pseudoponticoccus marisrubri]|uniref:Pilus assembly protein PilP n=1 Tax=Pseudoponticoccus marisrubri TaxID=1685382 RepID=A0A0W7WLC9_9RHOB|nr:hypothetical protein [Pseudoponticoccus marisrubri]KUF11387.1 hypothetical protein AVJ23_06370 [Pseudoponticoccus marisrubri]